MADDKNLIVWDLYPATPYSPSEDTSQVSPSPMPTGDDGEDGDGYAARTGPTPRRPPTALVIPFAHALTSVASHPASHKDLLVSDARGSVFLTDWRRDPALEPGVDPNLSGSTNAHLAAAAPDAQPQWAQQSVLEFTHPRVLGDAAANLAAHTAGCAAWRPDNPDMYV